MIGNEFSNECHRRMSEQPEIYFRGGKAYFSGHTCGECAWWRSAGLCRRYGIWCLHYGVSCADGFDPACPAFVAREEAK